MSAEQCREATGGGASLAGERHVAATGMPTGRAPLGFAVSDKPGLRGSHAPYHARVGGRELRAGVVGGEIVGHVVGAGPPVVLLHGGPGLSPEVTDTVLTELVDGYQVVSFQQRGLSPSTTSGPFDVATSVDDVRAVLDALGWQRAFVVGHSWGGHLALHVAVAMPERLLGVLCVDPLGAVGDGGNAEFEAEMNARTPEDVRREARELDKRAIHGEGTEADALKGFALVWPAYFARWDDAPQVPDVRLSVEAYSRTFASLIDELPRLEAALPYITVAVGLVAGGASPMPVSASTDTAARIPGAWVEVVEAAGHVPWHERPGCVRKALDRLAAH